MDATTYSIVLGSLTAMTEAPGPGAGRTRQADPFFYKKTQPVFCLHRSITHPSKPVTYIMLQPHRATPQFSYNHNLFYGNYMYVDIVKSLAAEPKISHPIFCQLQPFWLKRGRLVISGQCGRLLYSHVL